MDLSTVRQNDVEQTSGGKAMMMLGIGWGLGILCGFFAGWAWGVWRLGQQTRIERLRDELAWMRR